MRVLITTARAASAEARYRVAVIGVFAVAALLRVPATVQELPPFQFCDELLFSSEAQRLVLDHQWVTLQFRSGGLNIYPMVIVGRVLNRLGLFDPTAFVIEGRWLYSVLLASAAVFFVAGAARVLTGSRRVGLIAALLFLLSPSLLAVSRYWYPDHYSVLFSSVLVYLLLLLMRRQLSGRRRITLIASVGAALGASLAVKYTFSVAGLPVLLALASQVVVPTGRVSHRIRQFVIELGVVVVVTALVAVLLNFSAIVNPVGFSEGFNFNVQNYGRPGSSPSGIVFYAFLLFVASLGILGVAGFVVGVVATWKSGFSVLLVLLSFPIANIMYLGLQGLVFNRNIIASIAFILPVMSLGLYRLLLFDAAQRVRRTAAIAGLSIAAALQVAQVGTNFVTDLAPDSEPIAAAWIGEHIPKTTTVGVDDACSISPAQVAGNAVESDPYMQNRLQYYVINSYWDNALNKAFRGRAAAWSILDQKYLHYYYESDRALPTDVFSLPWIRITPQQAAPPGYRVIRTFDSNGPAIVVLRRTD